MKTPQPLHLELPWMFGAICCGALLLAPSVTFAQSSGPTVDVCSSGVVDSNNGVEETVCLSGDIYGLEGTAEVSQDLEHTQIHLGLDAQIYENDALWADSGETFGTGYATAATSGSAVLNQPFQFIGVLSECEIPNGDECEYWVPAGGLATQATVTPPGAQGFINPKYLVVGVTYAPPGSGSYVQYTGTTSIGNTTTIANSFSNTVGFSVSVQASIQGWGAKGSVAGTSSTDYTQGSNSSATTTFSKATSLSYKTAGTGNAFSPVESDYDTIWLWLNPVVLLTYTPETPGTVAQIQWNGYGYDTNDPSGTEQPDVYPVLAGWLNGDFGDDPSVDAVLARSWASSSNGYVWPSGEGPGLTPDDKSAILSADPFSGCAYDNAGLAWTNCPYASSNFGSLPPSTTPDGRFTLVTLPQNPNPIPYVQAGPGSGAGTTTSFSINETNTQSVAQGTSSSTKQAFSMEEVFADTIFGNGITTSLTNSDTLTWNNSWLNTLTTTTTLQQALSITGPNCPADPGPCSPLYDGPGQFDVYQDNQYGTFMFYPTN